MRNPRATSWRNWCRAGSLAGVVAVAAATALAPGSELDHVGYASRPGQSAEQALSRTAIEAEAIQAQIDATLPIVDDDDASAATGANDRPMYRLPAIEEMTAPSPVDLPPVELPAVERLPITPLPPTDDANVEPPVESFEPEPPTELPTITILPPVDTPPDMLLEEESPPNEVVEIDEVLETDEFADSAEAKHASAPPTITILPPVDFVEAPPFEPEADFAAETPEEEKVTVPNAPTITILPPVESQLPPRPIEADQPKLEEGAIEDDFDAAWNEGDAAEVATETPAAPALPVLLPPLPPLIAEPEPPAAEPGPPMILPIMEPQADTAPPQTKISPPQPEIAPPQITPYAPTTAELSRQLLPAVQKAYRLAQQGAVYAAQAEFIQVLRRIAEAKDSAAGTDAHSRSLAAGLRAIDEADDFAPKGSGLEADVNVAQIASAHRTPVLKSEPSRGAPIRPAVAVARYHEFARAELAKAVVSEQAGSMALHGLGKVHLRLARGNDHQLQHERTALAMFAAALDAGPTNHLAANEIGVLLSRAGYPAEASAMFRHAIDLAPTSTAYHNLAMTDQALGFHAQASANERYAIELAQRDRAASAASRSRGVAWVAPQELSRMAQPMPIESNQPRMASAPPQQMVQPVGASAGTASKWPKKLIPGSFWR